MPALPQRPAASFAFTARGEDDTDRLGRALADALEPEAVVGLIGNLGAGKTRLAQAVAEGLGIDRDAVGSPTFVLIAEYQGRLPLYHFDTYRLRDTDEFLELGADELLSSGGVCIIEWADLVAEVLPQDVLWIDIEPTGASAREFRFAPGGARSRRIIEALRTVLGK